MKVSAPPLFCVKNTLGSLEYRIMKDIWKNGQRLSVRDILNLENKSLAYTTIMTVVDHLYNKGFLLREKVKKTYYYSPAIEKNYAVGSSLSKVFGDLNRDYGKRKILYLAVSNTFPKISIELPPYSVPAFYGFSASILLFIFFFSIYGLLQSSNLIAIKDYLGILISGTKLLSNSPRLLIQAIIENTSFSYIFVTLISILLIAFLAKKISRVFEIKVLVLG